MSRRSSSLANYTGTAIAREIDSKYDVIKTVSNYLDDIEIVAQTDIDGLIAQLESAQDFTGISVDAVEVTDETEAKAVINWDPITKLLTVPAIKGTAGTDGVDGVNGKSAYEVAVDNGFVGTQVQWLASLVGAVGPAGADGADGANGADGVDGLTPQIAITYDDVTGNLEYEVTYV